MRYCLFWIFMYVVLWLSCACSMSFVRCWETHWIVDCFYIDVFFSLSFQPKSRSTPWNGSANTSFQDVQRQQHMQAAHSATGWGTPPTSGVCWGDNPSSSTNPAKPMYVIIFEWKFLFSIVMFFRTGWTELKPASSPTVNKVPSEPSKESLTNTRAQDALSKWTHNQMKDNSKDIDGKTRSNIFLNSLSSSSSSSFEFQHWYNY